MLNKHITNRPQCPGDDFVHITKFGNKWFSGINFAVKELFGFHPFSPPKLL